jgi:hypothetical protein
MRKKILVAMVATALVALWIPVAASAHVHFIVTPSHQQDLANGANHPAFTQVTVGGVTVWQSCGLSGAAYGMETAHHGPDIGAPGAGDGCYANETRPVPGLDANPVIN